MLTETRARDEVGILVAAENACGCLVELALQRETKDSLLEASMDDRLIDGRSAWMAFSLSCRLVTSNAQLRQTEASDSSAAFSHPLVVEDRSVENVVVPGVLARDSLGRLFNIEMQTRLPLSFPSRLLYYNCKESLRGQAETLFGSHGARPKNWSV